MGGREGGREPQSLVGEGISRESMVTSTVYVTCIIYCTFSVAIVDTISMPLVVERIRISLNSEKNAFILLSVLMGYIHIPIGLVCLSSPPLN